MDSLPKDFEKVAKKQKTVATDTIQSLEQIIKNLQDAKEKIKGRNADDMETEDLMNPTQVFTMLNLSMKQSANQLQESHKDLYNMTGKYSKNVEKKFKIDLDTMWNPKALSEKEEILANTIALHLVREGKFRVAETFVKEAGIEIPSDLREQFSDMFHILQSMHESGDEDVVMEDVTLQATVGNNEVDSRNANFGPALDWARRHSLQLMAMDSTLEFAIHKCRYLQCLRRSVDEALKYAREYLARFMSDHTKEVERLLGAILYRNRLATSPYSDLASPTLYNGVIIHFVRDFCAVLGLPSEPPLQVAVQVGTLALPTLHKMSLIMKDKTGLEWTQQGELPVEIPLVDRHRYHSIFACPVTKEAYSGGEENPPMMMKCGHVISKDALNRLSKNNPTHKFKCPYCPDESTSSAAIQVYF